MGMVELGSEVANSLGFTKDKFFGYLWQDDKDGTITISLIDSKDPGKGNLKKLFSTIEGKGYRIVVPNPMPQMEKILERWGYDKSTAYDKRFGTIDLWQKKENAN